MEAVLWEYRYIIIIFAVMAFYYFMEWQRSKIILYALMLQAKRQAGLMTGISGKEQEDWVIKKAVLVLPVSIKVFLNENVLRAIVNDLYHALDDLRDLRKTSSEM